MTTALLTAPHGRTDDKIQVVKAVRMLGQLGLKEAKEIVDAAEGGRPTQFKIIDVSAESKEEFSNAAPAVTTEQLLSTIRYSGYSITIVADNVEDKILDVVKLAMDKRMFSVAADLLQIITRHSAELNSSGSH